MTNKERVEAYLKHFGTKLSTDYKDKNSAEYTIYPEPTADGHQVFIFKYKSDNTINIEDHVCYYSNDLFSILLEKVQEGCKSIYIDEDLYNDMCFEEDLAEEYDKWKANS